MVCLHFTLLYSTFFDERFMKAAYGFEVCKDLEGE